MKVKALWIEYCWAFYEIKDGFVAHFAVFVYFCCSI
jgi:hypothetical protein